MGTKQEIFIIGGGALGTALANVFSSKHNITIYSLPGHTVPIDNNKVTITHDFQTLQSAKYVFIVVPSTSVRDVCKNIKNIVSKKCKLILCSKGIEIDSGKLMSEVVNEFFPLENISILSGPNFAYEIAQNLPTVTSIATQNIELACELSKKFSTKNFKFIAVTGIVPVQLLGTIKNMLAILCGVSKGLELGTNFTAAIVTAGAKEYVKLSKYKGECDIALMLEPAGIGDIFLTCSSLKSRNNKFGNSLVTQHLGKTYKEIFAIDNYTVEGVSIILALKKWKVNSPLINFAYNIVFAKYKNKAKIIEELTKVILNTSAHEERLKCSYCRR